MKTTNIHLYIIDGISLGTQYGIGTYICQLINIWRNQINTSLTIIKIGTNALSIEEMWSENIRYLWLPECNTEEDYSIVVKSMLQCISQNETNIFHFNYLQHYLFAKKLRHFIPTCKIILTIHYFNWSFMTNGNSYLFMSILKKKRIDRNKKETLLYKDFIITKSFFKLSDKIVCLSQFSMNLASDIYGINESKIKLIFNALPDKAYTILEKKRKYSLWKNERILLFVGRLVEQKGVVALVKAFRILLQKHKNIRLLIVGNGNYDCVLCECNDIWQHITFTGNITREKLYQLYQLADIGILPSFNEQCSYVIIEMMMHGLPIVSTDSTGLSEMIKNGYNGYKVHVEGDIESERFIKDLEHYIDTLLLLPKEDLDSFKRNSRNLYLSKYNMANTENKIKELWLS